MIILRAIRVAMKAKDIVVGAYYLYAVACKAYTAVRERISRKK